MSCDDTLVNTRTSTSGQRLKIYYDRDTESPRKWDNLGTMVCLPQDDYGSIEVQLGTRDACDEYAEDAVVALPVYAYYERIEAGDREVKVPHWDDNQIGYIIATEERIKGMYDTRPSKKQIIGRLRSEIDTYGRFAWGEVYRYKLYGIEVCSMGHGHENLADSCGGFYSIEDILDDTKAHDWEIEEDSD